MLLAASDSADLAGRDRGAQSTATQEPRSGSTSGDAQQPILVGATLETYYQFNWNRVPDRTVPLRAYDTRANTFSLQQIGARSGRASGRRLATVATAGASIFQFGQATETVQGSPANEPRPDVYRHVWQAYGSYVFPLGPNGLQADAGKFASNLGYETNYAKDNQAFSRALSLQLSAVLPRGTCASRFPCTNG